MKKRMICMLLAVLCLAGCGQPAPVKAADGADWNEDWVTVGNIIGADTPDGLEPQENSGALAASGMYYATWSIGEAEPYTNADGDEAEVYDACVYLLLAGYNAAEKAEENKAEWLDMARERYLVEEERTAVYNGQEFTVLAYTFASGDNPYARGASAFGVYRNYAISVELSCQEDFDGNEAEILAEFLENFHYAD